MTRMAVTVAVSLLCAASLAHEVSGAADPAADPPGRTPHPRVGLSLGGLLPMADSYWDKDWLTSARLSLQQDFHHSYYVEMGIPFAGIAWSGGLVPADCETRVVDWTIFDAMAGRTIPIRGHRAHFGLGMGMHRINVSGGECIVAPLSEKAATCKGKCGRDRNDTVFCLGAGAGYRLIDEAAADLDLTARFQAPLPPKEGEDDVAGRNLLVQLSVIF